MVVNRVEISSCPDPCSSAHCGQTLTTRPTTPTADAPRAWTWDRSVRLCPSFLAPSARSRIPGRFSHLRSGIEPPLAHRSSWTQAPTQCAQQPPGRRPNQLNIKRTPRTPRRGRSRANRCMTESGVAGEHSVGRSGQRGPGRATKSTTRRERDGRAPPVESVPKSAAQRCRAVGATGESRSGELLLNSWLQWFRLSPRANKNCSW